MVYTASWQLAESPDTKLAQPVPFVSNDTKPHTSRLDELARRDARFPLNLAAFIAELESLNPAMAALLVPVFPLVVLTAPAAPTNPQAPVLPITQEHDTHAVPKATQALAHAVHRAAEQGLVCGWYMVATFPKRTTREQARTAKTRLLAGVSKLGSDRGAWLGVGLRKGGGGEHLDCWLVATEAEAIALRQAHREEHGALVSLTRMGTRRGKADPKALADPRGPEMRAHYSRLAGYVTRRQGERDTLLDFEAVGVLRGAWIEHRDAVVGAPDGRRCACCSRALPPPKSTGRRSLFCNAKCKSKHHRAGKTKLDTKPDTQTARGVASHAPNSEPNPTSEFRIADHAPASTDTKPRTSTESTTDAEPVSEFRIAPPTNTDPEAHVRPVTVTTRGTKPDTNPEPETIIDPLEAASEFALWFEGPQAPPPELEAAVIQQLVHYGVQVPEQRSIERALRRAIVAMVTAA